MIKKICLFSLLCFLFLITSSFADDILKGKSLFNDPKLGGGGKGKSCSNCHPESSVVKWLDKKEYVLMGKKVKSIEEAINICIEKALGGKALDIKSNEMKSLVAYIKSFKK